MREVRVLMDRAHERRRACEAPGRRRAPVAGRHVCQLYEHEHAVVDATTGFLETGFAAGDAVMVIGTPGHVHEVTRRLAAGHDLVRARAAGRYLTFDAAATLDRIMVHGAPDRARFLETVGAPVADALRRHGGVRAFGEMVSLLWQRGEHAAAIALEDLWNELIGAHPVALVCGYSAAGPISGLADVVARHARVLDAPLCSAA